MLPLIALPGRRLRCAPPLDGTDVAADPSGVMRARDAAFATISVAKAAKAGYTFTQEPEAIMVAPNDTSKRIYCGCGSVVSRVSINRYGEDVKFSFYVGGHKWYPYRLNSVVVARNATSSTQNVQLFYLDGSDFRSRDVKPLSRMTELVQAGCAFAADL